MFVQSLSVCGGCRARRAFLAFVARALLLCASFDCLWEETKGACARASAQASVRHGKTRTGMTRRTLGSLAPRVQRRFTFILSLSLSLSLDSHLSRQRAAGDSLSLPAEPRRPSRGKGRVQPHPVDLPLSTAPSNHCPLPPKKISLPNNQPRFFARAKKKKKKARARWREGFAAASRSPRSSPSLTLVVVVAALMRSNSPLLDCSRLWSGPRTRPPSRVAFGPFLDTGLLSVENAC